jgi:transglutaminase/protease-like cytokinesis protein 3
MWQIDFDNLMYVNMAQYQNNALTYNGNKFISLEDLKKIKEIIVDLKSQGNFTDLQIIILVANYLQKNTEYVCENYFEDNKTIYKLDTYVPNIEDEVGLIETILLKKYGLCTGIANATTLLLNNTEFNIDARTIANHNHALNIVRLDNQYYFIDNTWGITRSPKEFEKAKKTLFFNSRFLLFGQNTFEYFHQPDITTFNPHFNAVPDKNFKQKEIIKAQNQMQNKVSFTYPEKIILPLTKTQK